MGTELRGIFLFLPKGEEKAKIMREVASLREGKESEVLSGDRKKQKMVSTAKEF